jgi:acyl-CoA reductase-like NAD-dependent aldehyde dehydrogenase
MKMRSKLAASAILIAIIRTLVVGVGVVRAEAQQKDAMCVETAPGTCTPMEIPPMVDGSSWMSSVSKTKDIWGCCQQADGSTNNELQSTVIGKMPQFSEEDTMKVLEKAKKAWDHGKGVWPQMSMQQRIEHVEKFLQNLRSQRSAIIQILMFEIGKSYPDAASEFDRTIAFCRQVIEVIRTDPEYSSAWQSIGSTRALVRRAAIGIIMALGPYNYPRA